MTYRRPEVWIRPTVEKGVPLPKVIKYTPGRYRTRSLWDSFLADLEVGDSFVVKAYRMQMIGNAARRSGVTITSSREPEGMVRVWRIAVDERPEKPRKKWLPAEKRQVAFPPEESQPSPSVPSVPSIPPLPSEPPDIDFPVALL